MTRVLFKAFSALSLLLSVLLGTALGTERCEKLLTVFEEIYELEYRCFYCGDNILTLVRAAKQAKLNMGGARVLIIIGGLESSLVPRQARMPGATWTYHVVLEVDGRIFDFDYRNVAVSVPINEYFDTMFATKSHLMKRIPVWSYLKDGGSERATEVMHSVVMGDMHGVYTIESYLRHLKKNAESL